MRKSKKKKKNKTENRTAEIRHNRIEEMPFQCIDMLWHQLFFHCLSRITANLFYITCINSITINRWFSSSLFFSFFFFLLKVTLMCTYTKRTECTVLLHLYTVSNVSVQVECKTISVQSFCEKKNHKLNQISRSFKFVLQWSTCQQITNQVKQQKANNKKMWYFVFFSSCQIKIKKIKVVSHIRPP